MANTESACNPLSHTNACAGSPTQLLTHAGNMEGWRLWPGMPLPGEIGFGRSLRTAGDHTWGPGGGMARAAAAAAAGGWDSTWYGSPECGGGSAGVGDAALHSAWPLGSLAPWGVPQSAAPLGPIEMPAAAAAAAAAGLVGMSPVEVGTLEALIVAAQEAEDLSAEVAALERPIPAAAAMIGPSSTASNGGGSSSRSSSSGGRSSGGSSRRVILAYGVQREAAPAAVGARAVFASMCEASAAVGGAALLAHARAPGGSGISGGGGDGANATATAAMAGLLAVSRPPADMQLRILEVDGGGDEGPGEADAAAVPWRECQDAELMAGTFAEYTADLLLGVVEAPNAAAADLARHTARKHLADLQPGSEWLLHTLQQAAYGGDLAVSRCGCGLLARHAGCGC